MCQAQLLSSGGVIMPAPAGIARVIGKCACGGEVVEIRHEVTVQAGDEQITSSGVETGCTSCGDDWKVPA
jgi:hypothetical protein